MPHVPLNYWSHDEHNIINSSYDDCELLLKDLHDLACEAVYLSFELETTANLDYKQPFVVFWVARPSRGNINIQKTVYTNRVVAPSIICYMISF